MPGARATPERGSVMPVAFRNVDASPSDPVQTWPYEALVTVLERGLVADWQPVFAEVRRQPWGNVARRIDEYLAYAAPDAVNVLFRLAIDRARTVQEQRERLEVSNRVRAAIAASGMTASEFARQVGTSASRLSTYASGTVIPSATMLLRIERHAGVTPK